MAPERPIEGQAAPDSARALPPIQDPADRLPLEREHRVSGRQLAWTLGLAAALVFVVNAVAVRLSPWSERTFDGLTVMRKWELASAGVPSDGIVVIGDSSGNFAVVGAELEAALGVPARNLCTYGRFQVAGAGWFLDRAIEASDAPPALVLVVLGSRTFALEADGYTLAQVPTGFGSWSGRAPHVGLTFRQTLEAGVARTLPLFSQSKSFASAIRRGRWRIDPTRLQVDADGSALLPGAYPDGVAPFAEKTLAELAAVKTVPSSFDRAAIAGLVADAEARGYDLLFVDGPIWRGLGERAEHAAFLARVHGYLDEACAASSRAARLTGPLQLFEAGVMENPYHLTRDAAVLYTGELARRLAAAGYPR